MAHFAQRSFGALNDAVASRLRGGKTDLAHDRSGEMFRVGVPAATVQTYEPSQTTLAQGECVTLYGTNTPARPYVVGPPSDVIGPDGTRQSMRKYCGVGTHPCAYLPCDETGTPSIDPATGEATLTGGAAVTDNANALPSWVLPVGIGAGVLAVGGIAYLALRKKRK